MHFWAQFSGAGAAMLRLTSGWKMNILQPTTAVRPTSNFNENTSAALMDRWLIVVEVFMVDMMT